MSYNSTKKLSHILIFDSAADDITSSLFEITGFYFSIVFYCIFLISAFLGWYFDRRYELLNGQNAGLPGHQKIGSQADNNISEHEATGYLPNTTDDENRIRRSAGLPITLNNTGMSEINPHTHRVTVHDMTTSAIGLAGSSNNPQRRLRQPRSQFYAESQENVTDNHERLTIGAKLRSLALHRNPIMSTIKTYDASFPRIARISVIFQEISMTLFFNSLLNIPDRPNSIFNDLAQREQFSALLLNGISWFIFLCLAALFRTSSRVIDDLESNRLVFGKRIEITLKKCLSFLFFSGFYGFCACQFTIFSKIVENSVFVWWIIGGIAVTVFKHVFLDLFFLAILAFLHVNMSKSRFFKALHSFLGRIVIWRS
eukprot:TRINITY_DN5183_c0_g1_i3.p1 TRINITY_DN5183_c0_g1~~TRINITY_DN5183_c0_g1_i3.p1  ORF type:complete len:370 (-),score=57.44 TRINITY_DN5183_c0_g1_i3:92-1201(-)